MKRTVWINGRFLTQPLTGVQRYAWELVRGLDALVGLGDIDMEQFKIELIVPSAKTHDIPLDHIQVKRVGHLKGQAWEQIELPFFAWGKSLVCLCNSAPILPWGGSLALTIHDLSFRYYPHSYSLPYRMLHGVLSPRLMKCADRLVTVSYAEKARLLKYHPEAESRLRVVHHGGDHVLRSPALPVENAALEIQELVKKNYILFIGSFNPLKNLKTLVQAFATMACGDDIHLVVVGGGGKVFQKMDLPGGENLSGKIHFLGQVNDPCLIRLLYEKARMLVAPSLSESFGLPCLEAMRLGCPVIASDIPAFREICAEAVQYIQPKEADSIASVIANFLHDEKLREEYRQRGLARAEKFTWEKTARETWKIILESMKKDS